MDVLVAGAGGAVGRETVRALAEAGHRVRAVDARPGPGVAVVPPGAGREAWSAHLAGCEAVVAVASRLVLRPPPASLYPAPFSAGVGPFGSLAEREALAERAIGPLADAAVDAGVRRFVLVSAAAVHGPPPSLPAVEGDPKRPATEGARRVWQLERRVFLRHVDRALPLAVLRPALVYGPGVRGPVLSLLAHLALAGARGRRPWSVRRGPVVHLVHVEDVARAAAFFLGPEPEPSPPGQAFFVADETPLPLEEVVAAAASGLGLPPPGPRLPYLPRGVRLLSALVAAVPADLYAAPFRAVAARWSAAARRHRLVGALSIPVPAVLEALGRDHYYDGSRLASLGFVLSHPSAPEGLAAFARALVGAGTLPSPAAARLPPKATPPGGVTIPPGPTVTALP